MSFVIGHITELLTDDRSVSELHNVDLMCKIGVARVVVVIILINNGFGGRV